MPFGFQTGALSMLLRERDASLTAISLSGALALPWLLKPLWAPLIDRYGSARFGRRKPWIVAMQLVLIGLCVGASTLTDAPLATLLVVVLLMNLCTATMDIAVDGLAVQILKDRHLGYGNAAQVIGYKVGMLASGGLLVWWLGDRGWSAVFLGMAALTTVVLFATLLFRECKDEPGVAPEVTAIIKTTFRRVVASSGLSAVALIMTYKVGEVMADTLFRPFLIDAGYSAPQLGLWLGTWGMGFSLAGSLAGGVLASRWTIGRAMLLFAAIRVVPLVGQWWLATVGASEQNAVIAVTCAEHFFGGGLTTIMFAFMMSRVDKAIGGTHFTVLAALEVLGKSPGGYAAGFIGDAWGYAPVFAFAAIASAGFVALVAWLRPDQQRQ